MDVSNLSVSPAGMGLAALAGLLSFLSPCVLALVPAYVGYLGGRSVTSSGEVIENRWNTFSHGLAFVLGFSLVFITGGAAVGAIGSLFSDFTVKDWISKIGGVVVIVFGFHTMGVINIPFLDYDTRKQSRPDASLGYLSSALMGIFFSAGWAPCVGPVLGAIYTLVLNGASPSTGVLLLSAYSVGMAVPFLLASLGIGQVSGLLRRHSNAIRYLSIATGVLLVIIGVMLFAGTLEQLAQYGSFLPYLGL
jgi:cytochrome c-type biogenesis protein